MTLIIDSGSTKMHLCLLAPDGSIREFELPGVNALTADEASLRATLSALGLPRLRSVFFYGAGVTSAAVAEKIIRALPPAENAEVCGDLLGAARALLGRRRGVACILGTGSNTGLYDGSAIVKNIPPLGYILGDEASGANLAINFLRALYRGELEPELLPLFERETGLTYGDILARVYRPEPDAPRANAFLASLIPFIRSHCGDFPLLRSKIERIFSGFFRDIVSRYDCADVALTGGIAGAFEAELRRACPPELKIIKVEARPMAGLVNFHSTHD